MREVEITVPHGTDERTMKTIIDRAISRCGLRVTLCSTLARFPSSVHWHLKHENNPGTLELTFWPHERRLRFTIQAGRDAPWIDARAKSLAQAIAKQR